MIEQLKKVLSKAIIEEKDGVNFDPINVLQYKTVDGNIVTLNKKLLTFDQINLLNVFLTPLANEINEQSKDQLFWLSLLTDQQTTEGELLKESRYFKFTHFQLKEPLHNGEEFEVALHNLFENEITVIWNSSIEGVIVEYIDEMHKKHDESVESLVEAIITDFYVQLYFYTGNPFSNLKLAKEIYNWEQSALKIGKEVLPNQLVFKQEQLIPHLLATEVSNFTKTMLLKPIETLKEDRELLKTIKVFLECNLNTTLAAKKMFMHRNSLQYRIDKFIEKTDLDIKQFPIAAVLYMLMALEESSN